MQKARATFWFSSKQAWLLKKARASIITTLYKEDLKILIKRGNFKMIPLPSPCTHYSYDGEYLHLRDLRCLLGDREYLHTRDLRCLSYIAGCLLTIYLPTFPHDL